MALGREVADAYISVHGDLSPFRRDLSKADKDIEDAAKKDAKTYSEIWGEHLKADITRRWNSIVDTMHSGKKIDLNRLIENFNPTDLDDAQAKVNEFLASMSANQKFIGDEYARTKKFLNDSIDALREEEKLHKEKIEDLKEAGRLQEAMEEGEKRAGKIRKDMFEEAARLNDQYDARRRKTMDEAIRANEAWAKTWEGMRKNNFIKDLEGDFARLSGIMNNTDMEKFANSFDSLEKARHRIYEVTDAMVENGRISAERAQEVRDHVNDFIDGESKKAKAMRDALDETNRLKKAQDKYNQSLNGMARTFHFGKLENDFRNLAAAMDSNDWSHFAKGADGIDDFRRNVMKTAAEMRRLGRVTDEEYLLIGKRMIGARDNLREMNVAFDEGRQAARRFVVDGKKLRAALGGINKGLRGTREHLQGFAGLNVFGDMIDKGLDFIHNLDRISIKAGSTATKVGSIGSVGVASLGGLMVVASDLGGIIGGLAAAAPAFIIGAGIGIGVMAAAFKDMDTVLADLKPAFGKLQDLISAKFWKQAAGPIRDTVKALMPLLQNKLGDTADAMGKVFGALATAIGEVPHEKIGRMFDRMNDAIGKLPAAMKPLVEAFTTLGDVGSEYFGRFSDWIVQLSTDFNNFIQKSAENGDLNKWIDNAIDGVKDMGRAIDGTFGIFNAMVDAAKAAGTGGLKEFADKLQAAADAMQSERFQDTLTMLFSGVNDAVEKIGDALKGLGPAIESVMPSIKLALGDIGDVAATIIGYIGKILSNPIVQRGITDFSEGMKKAIETLEPAIKPFGDSLGNIMSLLGDVMVSVAKIATAFTVELAPVLDSMSAKMQTLLDPLSDMAINVVKKLKPVAEALDTHLVGPISEALKSDLIPAFNGFVDKAGPVLTKIVEDLGPTLTTIVKDVLPNAVKLASELLEPLGKVFALFTPAVNKQIKDIGDGLDALGAAMRIVKGEARGEDWGNVFGAFTPEGFEAGQKRFEEQVKNAADMSWGDIFGEIFAGNAQEGMAIAWTEKIWPEIQKAVNWLGDRIADGWNKLFGNGQFWKDAQSNNMDLSRGIQELLADQGSKIDALDDTVNQWFEDNLVNPIKKGWDDAMRGIGEWWEGVKSNFQDFMSGLLGFDTHPGKPGSVTGGGGGKGMSVGGKLDPAMFGLPTEEGVKSYFTTLGEDIRQGFTDALNTLGEVLGISDFATKWDGFWTGVGTTVSDEWNSMTGWISTKYTEISTNVESWLADFGAGWDEFWANPGAKIAEVWQGMVDFITTKSAEIGTNVEGFLAEFGKNWDEFWANPGKKIAEVWQGMVDAITTKYTEISTNITTWLAELGTGWDEFWKGVGDKVAETWDNIVKWLGEKQAEIGDGIDGFITDTTKAWNDFWKGVNDKVTEVWNGIVKWIDEKTGGIATRIGTFIEDVKKNWNDFWAGVYTKVSETWEKVRSWIATKAEEIKDRISRFIEDVKTNWTNFWNGISDKVKATWEFVRQWIASKAEEIRSRIARFGEDVKTNWNNFWNTVSDKIKNTWEFARQWVAAKAEEIRARIARFGEDVKTNWNNFWNTVSDKIKNTWEFARQWVAAKAEEIRSRIARFGEDVKTNWNNFWNTVSDKVKNTWEFARQWVAAKAEEIRSRIARFGEDVKSNWNNFWNEVSTKVTNIWNDMKGAVERKAGEIIDFVRTMPQKITNQFSNMWGEMERIGGSIWRGLKQGIDNGLQWVTDAARNLARNAISAAKLALDINSPSKVFRKMGLSTGEGFVQGMDWSGNDVAGAGTDMAGLAIAAFAHSKMYLAGADAALGLADGLTAKKGAVLNALGALTPDATLSAKVSAGTLAGGVGSSTPSAGKIVNVGGITYTAPITNPEIAAHKVVDLLINNSNL